MSRYNKLPFERGRSAFQNQATSDWDITSLAHLEGQKVYLPNIDPTNPEVRRNGTDVVAVVVRNDSGGLLVPGTALWWKTGYHGTRVTASAATTNAPVCGFVDDHAPTAGIQDDDLFYMIVEGPATLVSDKDSGQAHGGGNLIEGELLVNSGVAGKVEGHDVSANAYGADANQVWNTVARVITTATVASGKIFANVKIPL